MSDHDTPPPAPTFPRWLLSTAGVVGSIVIIMIVLGVAYFFSHQKEPVDANIADERRKNLAEVQANQADLYNNYSWVDQTKKIVRIPVKEAMAIAAEKYGKETSDKPEAPARLSLAASPAGFVPPAPPTPPPPVAPAAPAPAGARAAPAAASAAPAAAAPSAAPAAASAP